MSGEGFPGSKGLLEVGIANPLFDSIRDDARYADLMRRLVLKQ